ncbi:MAG TPA: CHAT domain-containing protein, partial [Blastocatellia bacterium]
GVIYRRLGQPEKALDFYNQSLPMARAVGDRAQECNVLSDIGVLYAGQGEHQKALEFYSQALPIATEIGDRHAETRTLEAMADTYRAQGGLDEARAAIEKAIALTESVRSDVSDQELRQSFFATTRDRFDFYISILTELNDKQPDPKTAAAALEASEQERARGLLDMMALSRIDISQGVDPALKAQEQAVQAKISYIQSQLVRAASVTKPDQVRLSSLNRELSAADDDRRRMESALRRSNPKYAELRYPTRLDAASIQKLLGPDTLLLEYSLDDDCSRLFAVTNTDLRIAKLPSRELIRGEVDQVRSAISSPGRAGLTNYLRAATLLYNDVVAPASGLLAGKTRLVIVPDGPLYYLPFEVLLKGKAPELPLSALPYLVRDFSISYAPSASVLAMLNGAAQNTPEAIAPPSKDFLGFADPDYVSSSRTANPRQPVDEQRSSESAGAQGLDPLPGSRAEVQKIAGLFPADKVTLFLGPEATEENVKVEGRLRQYRYIHFAVHGLINEAQPQLSSLALSIPAGHADGGKASGEDGFLRMDEIFNLRMRPDLVTLSACESGLGKQVRGEGLVGLTRAFFYAGAPSLVVSLWNVDDRSTASLMEDFYRRLQAGGQEKADALRAAKLSLIRDGHFAHPYYWAAFVLNGKPE